MSSASAEHLLLLRRLRRLLLRSEHGQVLFLWGDDPRSLGWLHGELDRSLRARSRRLLKVPALLPDGANAQAVLSAVLTPDVGAQLFGCWVDLPTGTPGLAVRDRLLARFNERRAALLRLPRPVLIIGPSAFEVHAAEVAPDLWAVRSASFGVPAWPMDDVQVTAAPAPAPAPAKSGPVAALTRVTLWDQAQQAARPQRRWWQFWRREPQPVANLSLGFDAVSEALASRQLALAQRILAETARQIDPGAPDSQPAALRRLAQQRHWEGELAGLQRQWPAAAARHAEALQIMERLVKLTGESPEALRDWSVSLERVGDVQRALGDLAGARERYEQGLAVSERLVKLTAESPEALRDWSVSLNTVGDVQRALGDLTGARERYEQSLAVRERLVKLTGESPEALRDWSVSLDRVGDVQRALGDLAGARERYEQGLAVRERLVKLTGESPEALRDWSVSLNKVGDVQRALGDLAGARERYEQSLAVRERLVKLTGESPEALRDLSISLERMGTLSLDQHDTAAARAWFEQALTAAEAALRQSPLSQDLQNVVATAQARLATLPPIPAPTPP